jgi:hypothetical protein
MILAIAGTVRPLLSQSWIAVDSGGALEGGWISLEELKISHPIQQLIMPPPSFIYLGSLNPNPRQLPQPVAPGSIYACCAIECNDCRGSRSRLLQFFSGLPPPLSPATYHFVSAHRLVTPSNLYLEMVVAPLSPHLPNPNNNFGVSSAQIYRLATPPALLPSPSTSLPSSLPSPSP